MTDHAVWSRRKLGTWVGCVVWLVVNVVCVLQSARVAHWIAIGLRTDASVVGTFDDPGSSCPDRIEYVVDGVTYEVGVAGRGWCPKDDGDPTSPQRVFYDSDDPAVAMFADPGGPTPSIILDGVVLTLLVGLALWSWRRWWRWTRGWLRARAVGTEDR